jgi:N-methylhydantoinase A
MIRIGIDIGGTFTDFVIHNLDENKISTFKILTNAENPAETVIKGLRQIQSSESVQIIHGSTIATNALLEHKGVRTALIATEGFKDVLQIGRQNRPNLYDLAPEPRVALVPSNLRTEIHERVDHQGKVVVPLDITELDDLIKHFSLEDVKSIAVCLLFSFLNPDHEQQITDKLRESGYFVSASIDVLPEYREYERTSTTVINAYVSPILERYLSSLQRSLPGSRIQIMQSNGGMISLNEAKLNGARCILSGPAGGIIGAHNIARKFIGDDFTGNQDGHVKLITFDMGGTSTDVSLIDGQPGYTTEASIGGYPIHLPLIDIHTIGAGGGSIAYADLGGSLCVGPQSAGAFPGPACYGLGYSPTVTDANLVLGRLIPEYFLGGKMLIDQERATTAIDKLGSALNLSTIEAARGVIKVVNAQMERALRVISIERGYDPSDFFLFSFGGAGGLHAVELARQMNIHKVVISKYASTLSAYGMLASDVIKDYVRTVMLPGKVPLIEIQQLFSPLSSIAMVELKNEGINQRDIEILSSLDVRYAGQSYELNIPFSDDFQASFRKAHQFTYGYSYQDKEIEIVNLRLRAIGKVVPISLPEVNLKTETKKLKPMEYREAKLSEGSAIVPIYNYDDLSPKSKVTGPAIIVATDTTIFIDTLDIIQVDQFMNLIIDVHREN